MAHQGLLKRFTRSAGIGALAVSALVIVSPVAGAASAAPVSHLRTAATLQLNGLANVKTSNGVKWDFDVSWDDAFTSGGTASLGLDLERLVASSGASGFEFHSWSTSVKSSTLTWNGKTASLNIGTEASPLATAVVTFHETSSKKVTCTSGKETDYSGTMSGKATLVTGLSGGGTVSASSWTKAELSVDSGCLTPLTNPCVPELIAGAGFGGTGPSVLAGSLSEGSAPENVVGLTLSTTLTAPKGATRQSVAAMIDKAGKVYAKYRVPQDVALQHGLRLRLGHAQRRFARDDDREVLLQGQEVRHVDHPRLRRQLFRALQCRCRHRREVGRPRYSTRRLHRRDRQGGLTPRAAKSVRASMGQGSR